MRRELVWVIPVVLVTALITGVLLSTPAIGADLASILALPLGMAAVLAAILAIRGPHNAQPIKTWAWITSIAVSAMLILCTVGFLVLRRSSGPETLESLLSGEVKIGVSNGLPGWSERDGDRYHGFQVAIAEHLAQKYGFTPVYVPLDPGDQLTSLGNKQVKLLISNSVPFNTRRRTVDFAGPYFVDQSGIYYATGKLVGPPTPGSLIVCAQRDTDRLLPKDLRVTFAEVLMECLTRLLDPADEVNAVVANGAIVASIALQRKGNTAVKQFYRFGSEPYSIALLRNQAVCMALSDDLTDFLRESWDQAVQRYLPFADQSAKPPYGHHTYC